MGDPRFSPHRSSGASFGAQKLNCGCASRPFFSEGNRNITSLLHKRDVQGKMTKSVWLFARPLSWADFIIALQWVSDGKYPLCHWAVLVTHMDITANDEFMRRDLAQASSSGNTDWGIMYELRRNDINQNTVNIIRPFSPAALQAEWRLFSAKYIGTTEMSHDQIELEGISL